MRIVVIGATGTIGSAVADALDADHEVIRASRSSEVSVDMTDPTSIRAMYDELGTVDGVIVCAGGGAMKPLLELDDADIEQTLADKLMGQVNLVRHGVDHVSDGGVFLLTAGIFAQDPPPGVTAVAMVNGALESFARGAAKDLPRGIRINTVSPPFIEETARALGMDGGLPAEENAKTYVALIESERTGEVVYPGSKG